VLLLTLCLCGCSAVYSTGPFGEKPWNIEGEIAEWEGTWIYPDGALTVAVTDGSSGLLKVAWVEKKGGNDLKFESVDVSLREAGGWAFASMKEKEQPGQDRYLWARIKKDERMIVLWTPKVDAFRELVKAGRLPGNLSGDNVLLGKLISPQFDLITGETNRVLFKWDEPIVFFKMSK
jgi:hypothetical protein